MSFIFKVTSGSLVISDPCYEKHVWCAAIVGARNGNWNVQISQNRGKVTAITAWHIESAIERLSLASDIRTAGFLPYAFSIASRQFGYFDFDSYQPQPSSTSDAQYSILPNGVVVACGFADLQTRGIKDADGNVIALLTSFIPESVIETDDDEGPDDETEEEILD